METKKPWLIYWLPYEDDREMVSLYSRYQDYVCCVMAENQKEAIQKGTVIDWVNESRELSMNVYDSAKIDQNLSYRYMYDHFSTVKIQLRKGGLRLAKVLNELFG